MIRKINLIYDQISQGLNEKFHYVFLFKPTLSLAWAAQCGIMHESDHPTTADIGLGFYYTLFLLQGGISARQGKVNIDFSL